MKCSTHTRHPIMFALIALLAAATTALAGTSETLYIRGLAGKKVYVNGVFIGIARGRVCYFLSDGFGYTTKDGSPGWDARKKISVRVEGSAGYFDVDFDPATFSGNWVAVFEGGTGGTVGDPFFSEESRENAIKGDVSMFFK